MSNLDVPNHLQKKVKKQLDALTEEGKEVLLALGSVERRVILIIDTSGKNLHRLSCCLDGEIRNSYKKVSHEMEVMDEQITIARAIISINDNKVWQDDRFVEEETWVENSDLSSCSNYLLGKLARKVSSIKREGMSVKKSLASVKDDAEKILEKASSAAKLLLSLVEEDKKMLQVYKDVSKVMGSMDIEVTMLRATVFGWAESLNSVIETKEYSDRAEEIKDIHVNEETIQFHKTYLDIVKSDEAVEVIKGDDDLIEKDLRIETSIETAAESRQCTVIEVNDRLIKLSDDAINCVKRKTDNSEQRCIDEKSDKSEFQNKLGKDVIDMEVENIVAKNPKLASICQTSIENSLLVKKRLKERVTKARASGSSMSCVSDNLTSRGKVMENKLGLSTMVGGSTQSSTHSTKGYPVSTTDSMVETHRRLQLEKILKKFGGYGKPWSVGEYKEFKMMFEAGCPGMFWLHVAADAMTDLQTVIQRKLRGKSCGDGGGGSLDVGSMVLARYSVDKVMYRAKVEEVMEGNEKLISVRYSDYGNHEDSLTAADLFTWDPMLERIPPQAVPCCFFRAPGRLKEKIRLTLEEMEAFTILLKKSSPMQMEVHECLTNQDVFSHTSQQLGPQLAVSLRGKDGRDVLAKLSLLPEFSEYFIQQQNLGASSLASSISVAPQLPRPDSITNYSKSQLDDLLPPVKLCPVPQPLHLTGEDLAQVCDDGPPSPVHQSFTSRAVEKVQWWLDREEHGEDQLRSNWERKQKSEHQSFQEPDFLSSENMKTRAALLSQARKAVNLDHKVSPLSTDNVSANKCKPLSTDAQSFPFLDIRSDHVAESPPSPVSPYTPPQLSMQEVELDTNGEFQCLVSHIVSPEELYVHPVQEVSGNMQQLEQQLKKMVVGEKVATEKEVVVGSVWSVHQVEWYRVVVVSVTHVYGKVALQSIDYGHHLPHLDVSQLHRLPPGMASTLPGLAIRCHMFGIRPVEKIWDKLSWQVLSHFLEGDELYSFLQMEKKEGSMAVVIIVEKEDVLYTVNQRLVEVGCAISNVFSTQEGDVDVDDSGLENDWDPMTDDYNSTTNNYMTNDDDLKIATDGYKSKDKVCAFYLNRGKCYKGAYCEDKHIIPREGAVTTDTEEVIIETIEHLALPAQYTTALVKMSQVLSPSSFYILFPHGTRVISTIQPSDLSQSHSTKISIMQDSLQIFYNGNCRKLFMDSLPAPSSLLVTRSERDKLWHRAMVKDCTEGEVDVFFVDLGYDEKVPLSSTRKLESCFSVLPFQAVLARLVGVEPVGQGWCKQSINFFARITTSSQHLVAKIVASSPEQPLLIELSPRQNLMDSFQMDIANLLVQKGWARRVVATGGPGLPSRHLPG